MHVLIPNRLYIIGATTYPRRTKLYTMTKALPKSKTNHYVCVAYIVSKDSHCFQPQWSKSLEYLSYAFCFGYIVESAIRQLCLWYYSCERTYHMPTTTETRYSTGHMWHQSPIQVVGDQRTRGLIDYTQPMRWSCPAENTATGLGQHLQNP